MKLLIITQKVDTADDVLGFFHTWIKEFASHFEKVTVICLEKGQYEFPKNVSVFSLCKEEKSSRILYLWHFFKFIFLKRRDYDSVFVHMNPEYIVLGGFLWRLLKKKIVLWYVHRQVNLKLRVAEKFSHVIFSTTREAFRLRSKKVQFVGHGIDVSQFSRKIDSAFHDPVRILHVGRITLIKNLDILIETAVFLKKNWSKKFTITLIGAPKTHSDRTYERLLKEMVEKEGLQNDIIFGGSVSYQKIIDSYCNADISINLTPSGGMDKSVLESIASGTIILSANTAFRDLFGAYYQELLYNERDARDLATKIKSIAEKSFEERKKIAHYLYTRVSKDFSLEKLVHRISETLLL